MRHFLLSLCFLFSFGASAAEWKDGGGWKAAPVSTGADGVYQVLPDMRSPNNNHVIVCSPSSCTRTGDLPAPHGRGNQRLLPSAGFSKGAIVSGALALGKNVLPWLSVGMGLYDWYKQAGLEVNDQGDFGDISGAQALAPSVVFSPSSSPYVSAAGFFATRSQALVAGSSRYAEQMPSNLGSGYSCWVSSPSTWSGSSIVNGVVTCKRGSEPSDNFPINVGLYSRTDSLPQCYFVSDGRLSGISATGGVCPSGVFSPLSSSEVLNRFNGASVTPDVLRRSFDDVLKAGGSVADTGTHSVTGPSSIPGETKTKTSVSATGVTQMTTVTNTYNYNYLGDTFTITTTEVTQNPDGSMDSVSSDTPDPLCSENPNSLACAKLGDLPTDSPQWETKTISYQADSLGLPAACPAPWSAQLRGWTLSFSYQPACDVAPQIRLAVLALSSLGALLMIITTVRT